MTTADADNVTTHTEEDETQVSIFTILISFMHLVDHPASGSQTNQGSPGNRKISQVARPGEGGNPQINPVGEDV